MPAHLKDPSVRARRNKASTNATLVADPEIDVPELPGYGWHPMTVEWWADMWASPMAPEYDDSDRHGLFVLAKLVNDFWCCPADNPSLRMKLSAEIRMQRNRYGLSPMDRRSLQWEIARAEQATAARPPSDVRIDRPAQPQAPSGTSNDPRSVLRAV